MKRNSLFLALLISVISLSLIAASIQIMSISEGNGFAIIALADGSAVITNEADGYQFVVNNEWYPLLYPATEQDIENFKKIAEQKDIPASQVLNSLPPEEEKDEEYMKHISLILLDLNSNHDANGGFSSAALMQINIPGADFLPINVLLKEIKSNEKVSNFYQLEKNNQVVYAFQLNLESYIYKAAMFIRNNKVVFFAVSTDNSKGFTRLSSFFDETINSLEFYTVE